MTTNKCLAAAFGLAVGLAAIAPAYATPIDALSCQQLWVKRNMIYKVHGYCFKTPKARAYFGNYGCTFYQMEDVPLSKWELQRVLDYKHWETVNGC